MENKKDFFVGVGITLLFVFPMYAGSLQILNNNRDNDFLISEFFDGNYLTSNVFDQNYSEFNPRFCMPIRYCHKYKAAEINMLGDKLYFIVIDDLGGYRNITFGFKVYAETGASGEFDIYVESGLLPIYHTVEYLDYSLTTGGSTTFAASDVITYKINSPEMRIQMLHDVSNYDVWIDYYYYVTA
jgi:hypothetical protein